LTEININTLVAGTADASWGFPSFPVTFKKRPENLVKISAIWQDQQCFSRIEKREYLR